MNADSQLKQDALGEPGYALINAADMVVSVEDGVVPLTRHLDTFTELGQTSRSPHASAPLVVELNPVARREPCPTP